MAQSPTPSTPTARAPLTRRGCLETAARLARSAQRAAHPAARAGLAALALDWVRLAVELDGAPACA